MRLTVICRSRGRLAYIASQHGQRLREPYRVERWLVGAVNRTLCACFGHDRILEGIPEILDADGTFGCVACCARLQPRAGSGDGPRS